MTPQHTRLEGDGFVPFFRSYTKTWIHTIATAGLTAFGTLTIVHRWFAALALMTYVAPPIVLYLYVSGRTNAEAAHGRADPATVMESPEEASDDVSAAPEQQATPDRSDEEHDLPNEETIHSPDTDGARVTDAPDERQGEKQRTESPTAPQMQSDSETERGSEERNGSDGDENGRNERETLDERDTSADLEQRAPAADTNRATASENERSDQDQSQPPDWTTIESPTAVTLRDVVVGSSGSYAVGDGGVVLSREGDDDWTILLEDGPAAGSNDLYGVGATDDGDAVWVAGSSGSLGRIDPETGRHVDYTAPENITDNWLGIAVGGSSNNETVLLSTGSGAILRGEYSDGEVTWTGPDKPGSGSSLSAITLDDDVGYCCDTNDGVFKTTDGGESFEQIGLEGADGTLTDIAVLEDGTCLVSADDGVVHRYGGTTWTPERVSEGGLSGLSAAGERVTACGDTVLYEREKPASEWEQFDLETAGPLQAVSITAARGVAVGENGSLVERT